MSTESVFVLLFVVAMIVAIGVRYWQVPYTVGLVLAGLLLGVVHVLPTPHLTRALLYTIFLPGLIFEAAFHLERSDLRRNGLTILSLAVPGVAAAIALTTVILAPVAQALNIAPGFDWRYALVFGSLIAATDPIAVVAMLRSLGVPRRLAVLMEGESLLNDGTGIVFFTLSLAVASGGSVSAGSLTAQFLETVGIGGLLGTAVGLVISKVIQYVDDPMIEITLTTIAAYGAFVLAESLGYSGVIATVAAGLLCGNYGARTGMSASTRIAVETFWGYIAFALNSLIFLLIGLEIDIRSLLSHVPIILVAYAVVLLARAVVAVGMTAILRHTRERFAFSWSAVLTWGGLRGALPMVLALSLPRGFAHRELIINMTFGVVAIFILAHGLTMSPLLRVLGLVHEPAERRAHELARGKTRAASTALAELDRLERAGFVGREMLTQMRQEYQARLQKAQDEIRRVHREREEIRREELQWLRHRLILREKHQWIDDFREGLISREAYDELQADADARLLELESEDAR
jgi:CPA1 family monovalent cation:H+ antiporter